MDHQANSRQDRLHQAADQSRLLEGEDPDSTDPEDTLLWVGVYGELLELTGQLLASMDGELERMGNAVREATTDMSLIERKQRRYRRRLGYWEARARDLDGSPLHLNERDGSGG